MRRSIIVALAALALVAAPASAQFLLVPESSNDTVGMFDPADGSYLGVFANVPLVFGSSSTPINAVLGPDGMVYVSDQLQDAVFRFDMGGNYIDVFADASDGLDNIRGIAFQGSELYVTSGDDFIARFDSAGNRLADFFSSGADPFDIHFLPNGQALVGDLTSDNVQLYNANGTLAGNVISVNFPEQVQSDSLLPGEFLTVGFSDNTAYDFDLEGNIYNSFGLSGGRGIYRLGNGNLLVTNGSGVLEVDPATGNVIQTEQGGVSGRFIELVPEPASLVLLALGGLLGFRRR